MLPPPIIEFYYGAYELSWRRTFGVTRRGWRSVVLAPFHFIWRGGFFRRLIEVMNKSIFRRLAAPYDILARRE